MDTLLHEKLDLILTGMGYTYTPAKWERPQESEELVMARDTAKRVFESEPISKPQKCTSCGETFPHDRRYFFWMDEEKGILLSKCIKCKRAEKDALEGLGIKEPSEVTTISDQTKLCDECKVKKPLNLFYHHSQSPDGLQYLCKECFKTRYNK